MDEFKLVALRPLSGCDIRFLKILKENTTYTFYNQFNFLEYDLGKKVETVSENITPDLYSFTNNFQENISLNISAIVGENGSGKSSLVELFYVASYNLSVIEEVLFDEDEKRLLNKKDAVENINVEIFYKIGSNLHKIRLIGTSADFYIWTNKKFQPEKKKPLMEREYFYSLCINYSMHALNSLVHGDWLRKIFHKNDSYQTPIVLNPFRDEGNVDINNEEYLIKSRLLSNVLGKIGPSLKPEDSLRNLIDKKVAHKLKVQLNKTKFEQDDKGNILLKNTKLFGDRVLPIVFKYFLRNKNFVPQETTLNKYAKEYILTKLKNIASRYQPYKRFFRFFDVSNEISDIDTYVSMLSQDYSHVTFKLRQALGFLSNELYFKRGATFDLTISYLSNELEKQKRTSGKELIELLPPAFFDVDIIFQDGDRFNLLSSGEKQRVFSIATLVYHLSNLSSTEGKLLNLKYKRVNIVFDELELYFHPELQRKLVNDIRENLKKIDLKQIKALNILLITHSPFILSDIPESNILFLNELGEPERNRDNIKTFGGNIHELLAHSFFLKHGFIGEFAKDRIQELIDAMKPQTAAEQQGKNLAPKADAKWVFERINLIGEPFLKQKLLEMYYEAFDKQKRINELREELNRLES